jgi:septal ring factor EnvC (AmiA/AmiB activator)
VFITSGLNGKDQTIESASEEISRLQGELASQAKEFASLESNYKTEHLRTTEALNEKLSDLNAQTQSSESMF